ncbi:hypothetical protein C7M84_013494 [Penaeus vannamei]|uniref:Uncharacterized protein n=1 Tax=Penaeus vannamei TaxID=6689 RepID=A0A423SVW0_PENVA|nr:hypothetical protein C7M84_013494 [Penaeus vannamei]
MKLRVWVPEIGDSNLVTLISANSRTGKSRRIEIRKSGIIIQARDVATVSPEQELPIQNNSLPHGWVTFMVTSDENFTVTVPDANLTLIHIPDVVQDKNIKIRESYATVNCMLPAHHWEVSAGEEAFIPLSLEGPHDFSLFARAPFVPELAVGLGSLGPLRVPSLGSVFELESEQMAAFSFYNFTLDCTINETKSSCYIQAGDYKILVGSLPREAASLSLTAGGTDDYTIVHGIRKDQRWERTGDQSDENGGGPLITLSCPFVFIATFSVTVLSARFLMKWSYGQQQQRASIHSLLPNS